MKKNKNLLENLTKFTLDEEHQSVYDPFQEQAEYFVPSNIVVVPSCDGKSCFVFEIQKYKG